MVAWDLRGFVFLSFQLVSTRGLQYNGSPAVKGPGSDLISSAPFL